MRETLIPSDTPAEIVRLVEAGSTVRGRLYQLYRDAGFDRGAIQEAIQEESALALALACHGYAELIPLYCDTGSAYELDGPDVFRAAMAWRKIEAGRQALDSRSLSRHDAAAATRAARRAWEAVSAQLPTK